MEVEKQLNIKDRTLLLGVPSFNEIPKNIFNNGDSFTVIGVSLGVKPPYLSLEIEKTNADLVSKVITA